MTCVIPSASGASRRQTYRVARSLSLIGSYLYNESTYGDNTVDGTVSVAAQGVRTFKTRAHLARGEVSYDDGRFFGNLTSSYMNNSTDRAQKLVNAQFLHDQLAGTSGGLSGLLKPMQIQNPTSKMTAAQDPLFVKNRAAFLQQLQGLIKDGKVSFPPDRAITKDMIPDWAGTLV
jgi:hypothetical protein